MERLKKIKDKRIYSAIQHNWFTPDPNKPKFEVFETHDKKYIYSEGYLGGTNFEYYQNKRQLNILYPFPTFEEFIGLEIEHYTEHAYGYSWQYISPEIVKNNFNDELAINEELHNKLLEFFINDLETKDGLRCYMCSEFSHDCINWELPQYDKSKNKLKRLDKLFLEYTKEPFVEFGQYPCHEDCNWTVSKNINADNFLDIKVSIELPEYHNELCKVLCSETMGYSICSIFGSLNCIDGRMDDGSDYGVYCNLNLQKEDREDVRFPWTRCLNQK